MPTPVRLVERKPRRLTLEARPDWGMLGCGVVFLFLAFILTCWALANGLTRMALIDSCYLLLLDFVLVYLGVYAMFYPLGTEQVLTLDKHQGTVTVTTRGLHKPRVDRYRLADVIKVHHNRVDDGTFEPHTMLLIFRGGGAIQFPLGGGQPKTMALIADVVTGFLGVRRSDAPVLPERPAPKPIARRAPRRATVTVQWDPMESSEKIGTAPLE